MQNFSFIRGDSSLLSQKQYENACKLAENGDLSLIMVTSPKFMGELHGCRLYSSILTDVVYDGHDNWANINKVVLIEKNEEIVAYILGTEIKKGANIVCAVTPFKLKPELITRTTFNDAILNRSGEVVVVGKDLYYDQNGKIISRKRLEITEISEYDDNGKVCHIRTRKVDPDKDFLGLNKYNREM